ncbi:MAG: DegT/DnrJ/EryC1/StrS aminotransferase family protein [Planctomycetota bacterium]|nr:DegT/DnrJ/EryC1/StrS aminotransferase family protein [Planctomycetota bacterium]
MSDEIPLTSLYITHEEVRAIANLLRNTTAGAAVDAFEQMMAARMGRPHCISTTSLGTAIEVAMAAFGLEPGDEVIVPAIGARGAASAARRLGAKVIAIDVDPLTLCMRVDQAEAAITEQTRMVVGSAALGCPDGLDQLATLATRSEFPLLEIVGSALGGRAAGERVGQFGRIAVLDLGPASPISTGTGGLILTHDDHLDHAARAIRCENRAVGQGGRLTSMASGMDAPYDDLRAAMGMTRLGGLDRWIERREEIAGGYIRRLSGNSDLLLQSPPTSVKMGWCHMLVRLSDRFSDQDRDEVIAGMRRHEIDSQSALELASMTNYPAEVGGGPWPVAERAMMRSICLPFHNDLVDSEIDLICQTLELMLTRSTFRRD